MKIYDSLAILCDLCLLLTSCHANMKTDSGANISSAVDYESLEIYESSDALEGVTSANFEYLETGLFTGTQLVINPQENYKISCSINKDGGITSSDDFNIFCVRTI